MNLIEIYYLRFDNIDLMFNTSKITKENIDKTHVKMPSPPIKITTPDEAFSFYNGEDNPLQTIENQIFIRNVKTHTSMSVGDAISINGILYLCEDLGWRVL